jgi:hypothetical protein
VRCRRVAGRHHLRPRQAVSKLISKSVAKNGARPAAITDG